jgi:hypothetical protein
MSKEDSVEEVKDDDDSPTLSKTGKRIFNDQKQAFRIHKQIKSIQDGLRKDLIKFGFYDRYEREIRRICKEEKVNEQVFHYLETMYGIERPMTERERLNYVAKEAVGQYIEQMIRINENKIPLKLSKDGDLYRDPKEKYCYSFRGGDTGRLFLLRMLIDHIGPYPSSELQKEAGYASYKTLTDAIHAIKETACKKLSLPRGKGNDLIVNRNGYHVNFLYPIEQEK